MTPILFILFIGLFLFIQSCGNRYSFQKQKYTDLNHKKSSPCSVSLTEGESDRVKFPDLSELSISPVILSNEADNHSDTSTYYYQEESFPEQYLTSGNDIFLIESAIEKKYPIFINCGEARYLVLDPVYDSISNRLCGIYSRAPKPKGSVFLQIYLKPGGCEEINTNCISIKNFGSVKLRPKSDITTNIDPNILDSLIDLSIERGSRIYLKSGSETYLFHEPVYDSPNNLLCGRLVKIESEKITPNVCLTISKKDEKYITEGCIPLTVIQSVSTDEVEFKDESKFKDDAEEKRDGRNTSLAILFFGLSLLYLILGIDLGQDVKNQSLRQLVYLFFFGATAMFLVLFLICLALVLS